MRLSYFTYVEVVVLVALAADLVLSLDDPTPLVGSNTIGPHLNDASEKSETASRNGSLLGKVKLNEGKIEPIDGYDGEDVAKRTPIELLELRGFKGKRYFVRTVDGYYIHVVRIVNPLLESKTLKRPVVFNHGLLESSTIWLINSRDVKPLLVSDLCGDIEHRRSGNNQTSYLNGPMMLANYGYDVWMMSMRGTDLSLHHDTLKPTMSEFWDYSLDDFALADVPAVIDFVRAKTKAPKVGYIGHSQATFSVFGLLSVRPHYADIIEPVVAVAPVAYMDHITSVARALFVGTLKLTDKNKHEPFPVKAKSIRAALNEFCRRDNPRVRTRACRLIEMLVGGTGKAWRAGYFSHIPFYTSLKVLRHFGQLVKSKMFQMYDYGKKENLKRYRSEGSFAYPIEKIRSKSICLFSTKSDALSSPEDVEKFRDRLKVPLLRDVFIDRNFNHFDLITDEDARLLVFKPILEIFESLERESGVCASTSEVADDHIFNDRNKLIDNISNQIEVESVRGRSMGSIDDQFGTDSPIDEPEE